MIRQKNVPPRARRWGLQLAASAMGLIGLLLFAFGNALVLRLGLAEPALAERIESARWGFLVLGLAAWALAVIVRPRGRGGWLALVAAALISAGALAAGAALVPAQFGPPVGPPSLLPRERADLPSQAWVLGVALGEEARAYPWSLVRRRIAINDVIADQPVVIVYCISCNSALAYLARHEGRTLRFGPVGAYRSETLIHDTETGSWWREDGSALAGPLSGARLEPVASALMPWAEWLNLYPRTRVASSF